MIGFQREEDLRDNLAMPALSTIKKLKPKEVIAAEKHLKVPLGARRRGFTKQVLPFSGSK